MGCYQLTDVPLPLVGSAHSTRFLGWFQCLPVCNLGRAIGTLLCWHLSGLMDLVTIPDAKFWNGSTPFSTPQNSSVFLLSQDSTVHHTPAVQITVTPEEFTCSWVTVVLWNHEYAIVRNQILKLILYNESSIKPHKILTKQNAAYILFL